MLTPCNLSTNKLDGKCACGKAQSKPTAPCIGKKEIFESRNGVISNSDTGSDASLFTRLVCVRSVYNSNWAVLRQ